MTIPQRTERQVAAHSGSRHLRGSHKTNANIPCSGARAARARKSLGWPPLVMNFAVEYYRVGLVFIGERLMGWHSIDDAEAPHSDRAEACGAPVLVRSGS